MPLPFHDGELKVQRLAGEAAVAQRNGKMIARRLAAGALPFLQRQSMAVLGSSDRSGRMWCSILFGRPGFMKSEDGLSVDFDLRQVDVQEADPLWRNLAENASVGMLAFEPATRARIRINGLLRRPTATSLHLAVQAAYPNCSQYITRRQLSAFSPTAISIQPAVQAGSTLDAERQALLARADLLFIASAHPEHGADASHRGGLPGFVQVVDERTLRIPDYSGNGMFNTLGNLAVNARAGLAVPDFQRNRTLQLTGSAEILWNQDDPVGLTGGTQRFLIFHIERWLELAIPPGVRAEFFEYSAYNPPVAS